MTNNERTPQSPPEILPLPEEVTRTVWSVIIATFNCSNYLAKTLQSVLDQAPSAELMQLAVVDDCSSGEDVEAIVKRVGQGRVSSYKQLLNRASLRNFEIFINRAVGHQILILHADELFTPRVSNEIDQLFTP